MAGTITGMSYQKHTADRVNVYLDDRYAFALPALEAARLRVGQFLDDTAIERLKTTDYQQKAYDRAVRYLSIRPRSAAEIRRYLTEYEYAAEVVEAVVARLSNDGYLDDADFARFWVENRQQFRPKGVAVLRQELRQRGLDNEVIEGALAEVDPVEAAYRAARPRALRLTEMARSDPALCQRKLSEFLLRRGFDYDTVQEITARLMTELVGDGI